MQQLDPSAAATPEAKRRLGRLAAHLAYNPGTGIYNSDAAGSITAAQLGFTHGSRMYSTPSSPDRNTDIVVVAAVRTPIAKAKKGGFKDTTPDVLLGVVLRVVLERSGVPAELVGEVCVGNVLQVGAGAAGSRIAQMVVGMPPTVPLSAVNRQCSSGLQAVANIASGITAGYYDIGIAAGVESMSLTSMQDTVPQVDWEGMKTSVAACDCTLPMGITSENVAEKFGLSRTHQDEFAVHSHLKAAAAQKNGLFDAEITAVRTHVKDKDGALKEIVVSADEGVRANASVEQMRKLKPVFKENGTTTAGNSSQVSDGAAATLLTTRARAAELGLPILGVFRGFAVTGVPPSIMGIGPAIAIPAVLKQVGLTIDDIDVFEINEAFASQASYCIQELKIPPHKVNPKGGAIALGHPLGCTGCRQVATLLYELKRTGKKLGVVSMCIGTGMGAAAVFEAV